MSALPDVKAICESIRRACRPGTWSQGVNLARAQAVAVESQNADEIVLRVRAPGRPVAPTVVLYPTMDEWECDCPSRLQPCEHVAAAAIALAQAAPSEAAATEASSDASVAAPKLSTASWGRIGYRFSKVDGGLKLARVVVREGDAPSEAPLEGTLSGLLSKPSLAGSVQPEEADLQIDRLLETGARGILPPTKLEAVMRLLRGHPRVQLDGRPVHMGEEEILPCAVIEDRGDDVVVTIKRDPRITDVVSAGVALCGDALCALGETELAGAWLQNLPNVRVFGPRQLGEVTTKILPDLVRRMAVEVKSRRLPPVVRDLPPRLVLELNQVGGGALSVLPTLVYGTPPSVRIDEGKMVYLGGPVPVRNAASERRLVEQLRSELDLLPGRRSTFTGNDVGRFVAKVQRWRGDLTGDAAARLGADVRLEPRLALASLGDGGVPAVRMELAFEVTGTDARRLGVAGHDGPRVVDAAAVVRAWQDGLPLVPLDGGGWAPLPAAWLAQHGQKLVELLAARDEHGRVQNHALPTLGALCAALEAPPPPGLDRLAPLAREFKDLPDAPLPADLRADLRSYQRTGARWLAFLRSAGLGGVLADDMGLGKTLQALTAIQGPALVVAPTSVLPNWMSEIARFRPGLRASLYHGPNRALDGKADVTVTSYALLRLDAEKLQGKRWRTVILDEAQAIKNPDSQVARAAYDLEADLRLALTGTPIENRLEELWSLMHFTNRGLLGGRRAFDDTFARPIASGDRHASDRLRKRVRPFVLRRLKSEVAPDLPPRTERVLHVELSEAERATYDAVRAATRAEVVALLDGGKGVLAALEALLRLRQAACHPGLLPGQTAATSSKLEALLEELETAASEGHKALVFSQWTSLLDLVEPGLRREGITFSRLDGSTRDRGAVVADFQRDGGPPVMLLSLKAGGTGLNLTAADHVFLLDPWWNPAVEAQAADRAHRIGQERPVFVHRLVSLGTVEERILLLQEQKRALFEAALGDGGAATGLTREDLLALLA